jgi:hypothetical protein
VPFATAIAGLGLFLFMVFSRTGGLACDKPFIARFSMLLIGRGLARERFGGGTRISPRRVTRMAEIRYSPPFALKCSKLRKFTG